MNKSLELPWSMEETIENMRNLRAILIDQVSNTNYEGKGKTDAKEIKFDFDRAIYALEQQLADAWIPVTERLPEEPKDENYIDYIVTDGSNVTFMIFDEGYFRDYNFNKISGIIAWKPLPQPYKENTNETI